MLSRYFFALFVVVSLPFTWNRRLHRLHRMLPTNDAGDLFEPVELATAPRVNQEDVTLALYSRNIYRDCITATNCFSVDDVRVDNKVEADRCTVIFRGTISLTNWISNLKFVMTPNPYGLGEVHRGFLGVFKNALARPRYSTQITACATAGKSMYFTGHSLGGAVATLALASFMKQYPSYDLNKIHMATFGSPRVGNADFATSFMATVPGRVNRYEAVKSPSATSPPGDGAIPGDIVPRVPPMTHVALKWTELLSASFMWDTTIAEAFSSALGAGYRHVGHRFQLNCDDPSPKKCHSMDNVYFVEVSAGRVRDV